MTVVRQPSNDCLITVGRLHWIILERLRIVFRAFLDRFRPISDHFQTIVLFCLFGVTAVVVVVIFVFIVIAVIVIVFPPPPRMEIPLLLILSV